MSQPNRNHEIPSSCTSTQKTDRGIQVDGFCCKDVLIDERGGYNVVDRPEFAAWQSIIQIVGIDERKITVKPDGEDRFRPQRAGDITRVADKLGTQGR